MKIRFAVSLLLIVFSAHPTMSQKRMIAGPDGQDETFADSRVYYSVFVQSFYDSNGDGIGDIQGLISKLDYIKDLGVGGIWLLPVHPSPTYHKYDVYDYYGIHPDYGTLEDYKQLVDECHKRDLKILLDLVVNHASNQHPWFKEAASSKKSKYRDYFVWSNSAKDFEKEPFHWHQVRDKDNNKLEGERYYGFFWWEMPDWNLDNKNVRKEFTNIGRFWLDEIGIDGFRLDAARYIFPDDRLDDNLEWWEYFRKGLGKDNADKFIVAEIWGGSDYVAPYVGSGISAGFNFELSDSIRKSLREGINYSIPQTVQKITSNLKSINPEYQDAIFLTNHDMNRIMTELEGNELLAKAAATILFTLPGNPFVYYGEEIGMKGEKPDEFIREPFLWNVEGKDEGQTSWEIPYASNSNTVKPLEFQTGDPRSVYNTYKDLIKIRNSSPALRTGEILNVETGNEAILAYQRVGMNESYLIFVNLSGEIQRMAAPGDILLFESIFQSHSVFKGGDKGIALQPYSSFILKQVYQK